MKRDIKTKSLKTAMLNVATRIRSDLVLHVAFVPVKTGGHYLLWVTQAGDHNTTEWTVSFVEGHTCSITLPTHLTTEKE